MEVEVESAQPEVANPEVEVQQTQQTETETPPEAAQPKEDPQERNWREIRKTVSELKRENQYLKQKLETPAPPPPAENLDDEDIVTEKRLNKRLRDIETLIKQKEVESVEDRLKSKYSDFHEVVSEENCELLKQNDPELAASIAALQGDPYKQGLAAYKILKRSDYTQQRQTMQEKVKTAENAKKPVSSNAVRKQGALAEANRFSNGLTPDLKKALWKEMQEARKGA